MKLLAQDNGLNVGVYFYPTVWGVGAVVTFGKLALFAVQLHLGPICLEVFWWSEKAEKAYDEEND